MSSRITPQQFAGFLFSLAKMIPRYAPDFHDRSLVDLWYRELGPSMRPDSLEGAMRLAVRKFEAFPSIKQLLELFGDTEPTEADKGREVADRIWGAIERWGSTSWSQVQEHIGPIGVAVVNMQGGWNAVCLIADYDNAGQIKAQWRESAAAIARKGAAGVAIETPPDFAKLPESSAAAIDQLGAKLSLPTNHGRQS